MRVALALLVLLSWTARARAAEDDDPKRTRAAPAVAWPLADEDDPKLSRGAARPPWWQARHVTPRLKLAYRRLWAPGIDGPAQPFDVTEIDAYPLSSLLRLGIGAEFGWGGGTYDLWYLAVGASLGVQYPARVTPFLEGRFEAGFIGGAFQGKTLVSWIYEGGLDAGVEVYYWRRFYVSAAVGWVHAVYEGVDGKALMADPRAAPIRTVLGGDSVTVKVGLGF